MNEFRIIALTPPGLPDPSIAIAASRAGAVGVLDLEYTEDEKRFLADNEMMMGLGFCRQCRACVASCPHGVEVPELMRTHMYAAQYSNFRQARVTLDEIPAGRSIAACKGCDTCSAKCAHHVDIAYRIENLKLMYA